MDEPTMVARYILMAAGASAYLYDATASVVRTIGEGNESVCVVRVVGNDEKRADYLARYQLDRLYSGMEARSNTVFRHLGDAVKEAEDVYAVATQVESTRQKLREARQNAQA